MRGKVVCDLVAGIDELADVVDLPAAEVTLVDGSDNTDDEDDAEIEPDVDDNPDAEVDVDTDDEMVATENVAGERDGVCSKEALRAW